MEGFNPEIRIQCSPFVTLFLRSIGMDSIIREACYKGTILQRNYRKMTIPFYNFFGIVIFYNSFAKFMIK